MIKPGSGMRIKKITGFFTLTFFLFMSTAWSADIETSFPACKDLKNSQAQCPTPHVGFFSGITDTQDIANSVRFLQSAAAQYKKNVEANIDFYSGIRDCFAQKTRTEDCQEISSGFREALKDSYTALRQELALSQGPMANLNGPSPSSNSVAHINSSLRPIGFLPNPAGNTELSKDELNLAKYELSQEQVALNKALDERLQKFKTGDLITPEAEFRRNELVALYSDLENAHRKNYYDYLVSHPHLQYLPQASTGKTGWTDSQIKESLDELLNASREEIKRADAAAADGRIEFDRANMESFYKGGIRKQLELLDMMKYQTVTNQVLQDDPSMCSVAASLAERYNTKNTQNSFVVQSALLGLSWGVGKVLQLPVIGAVEASQMLRTTTQLGMSMYDFAKINPDLVLESKPGEVMGDKGLQDP